MHGRRLPVRVRYKDVSHAHPFQALRLSLIDARRSLGVFSCPSAHALGWLPFPRFAGVTRARCLARGGDKIAGSDFEQPKAGPKGGGQDARSQITCVVPSRYGVLSW